MGTYPGRVMIGAGEALAIHGNLSYDNPVT